MAKTPDDMMGAVTGTLAARTGRSLEEWLALVEASGIDPLDQNAVRRWLRTEHSVPQAAGLCESSRAGAGSRCRPYRSQVTSPGPGHSYLCPVPPGPGGAAG